MPDYKTAFQFWLENKSDASSRKIYDILLAYKDAFRLEYRDVLNESNHDTGIEDGKTFTLEDYIDSDLNSLNLDTFSCPKSAANVILNSTIDYTDRFITQVEANLFKNLVTHMKKDQILNTDYIDLNVLFEIPDT